MLQIPSVVGEPGQVPVNAFREIPRYMLHTSPVPNGSVGPSTTAITLPLNLILFIVSFLDDIGDLARVTRTSRLLYYMTLPQLYRHVNLHSYSDIRYVNGRPEGFGSGSPFTMALNGLIAKPHANLVQNFRLWGAWNEPQEKDFSKGRVPDNTMMLNIILRGAMDKMVKLESFSWELDCKPLKTVYQGLGAHNTLTSFTLRYPSSRTPRPAVLIPPMVNLRVFKATDIDPLCFPDDMSLLICHSRKLEDLRLHFSPRMRRDAEPILNLSNYFGRCFATDYHPKLKHLGIQNFFGHHHGPMDQLFDEETCTSVTFLDTFGGLDGDPKTVFADNTWRNVPKNIAPRFTSMRCNEWAQTHVDILARLRPNTMESMIFVGSSGWKTGFTPSPQGTTSPMTPDEAPLSRSEMLAIIEPYLNVITKTHGKSIKQLLLPSTWPISQSQLGGIIMHCPNLEQLGVALDTSNHDAIRMLAPCLPKLRALRILTNVHTLEHLQNSSNEERIWNMGFDLAQDSVYHCTYIGVGDLIYRVGNMMDVMLDDGSWVKRREVTNVDRSVVQHLDIWKLDVLDIGADPIAPFST